MRTVALLAILLGLVSCQEKNEKKSPPPADPEPAATTPAASQFKPAPLEWDVYLAKINDAPASVMVNFWFKTVKPMKKFPHLLWVFIEMKSPGEHGMGAKEEAAATSPLEGELVAAVQEQARAHFVGHIRGEGKWQLYFYSASDTNFDDAVKGVMAKHPDRSYKAGDVSDPRWETYINVLYPDAERLRWIRDGKVVEALEQAGDPLTKARRIDHWAYFKTEKMRDTYIATAKKAGFSVAKSPTKKAETSLLEVHVHRKDYADLERAHAVVMELVTLAEAAGGRYDGWETQVLRAESK